MIPYEVVDHTADIGIKAFGRSREELFAHMAEGMFSLIVPPESVSSTQTISLTVQAKGWEQLLVAWLRELLYRFDTQHFLGRTFEIQTLTPTQLTASVAGETLDLKRHPADKEIKAVTYCDLMLSQNPEGVWSAQVIFDI